ncbi:MAG: hypothetical protein HC897_07765 [Thermoanaerobaculia bacterium]|nr:hypothetical protein [Thermoanaerobaculia bacterium]
MNNPTARRGSAMTLVLMVMLILTAMGLTLVLITEGEMQSGGYEKTITRVFYAAETGIGVGTARILVTRNCKPTAFALNDVQLGPDSRLGYRVELPKTDVLLQVPCNFCPANEDQAQLYRVVYLMSSDAQRIGWDGSTTLPPEGVTPQAEKLIVSSIDIQPIDDPPTDCAPTGGGSAGNIL